MSLRYFPVHLFSTLSVAYLLINNVSGTRALGAGEAYPSANKDRLGIVTSKSLSPSLVSIVTGFFSIPGNPNRDMETYKSYMQRFLPIISTPMLVYTQHEDLGFLQSLRGKLPAQFKSFESVWGLPPVKSLRQDYVHQLTLDPERKIHVPEVFAVWNSKIWMILDASSINPYNSSYFLWVDIAATRWGEHPFRNWPDEARIHHLLQKHNNSILAEIVKLPRGSLTGYQKDAPFYQKHFMAGGIIGTTAQKARWLHEKFYSLHDEGVKRGVFIGKEQDLLNSLVLSNPEDFVLINDLYTEKTRQCPTWWYLYFFAWFSGDAELQKDPKYAKCQRKPLLRLAPMIYGDIKSIVE